MRNTRTPLFTIALLSQVALLAVTGGSVFAQQQQAGSAPARTPPAHGPSLELAIEAAQLAIATCANAGGQTIGVSVVDSAGVLKVLLAADGTSPRGVTSSTAKAVTALKYETDTQALSEQIKTNKALADEIAANTALNARPGGIVIKVGDTIIGAIGVGGGSTDHDCAATGLAAVQSRLK
ncbi:MAG: heme-binding protein [Pseudomonadota bacterium]